MYLCIYTFLHLRGYPWFPCVSVDTNMREFVSVNYRHLGPGRRGMAARFCRPRGWAGRRPRRSNVTFSDILCATPSAVGVLLVFPEKRRSHCSPARSGEPSPSPFWPGRTFLVIFLDSVIFRSLKFVLNSAFNSDFQRCSAKMFASRRPLEVANS